MDERIRSAMLKCPGYLDFPTAWAIQAAGGIRHAERCASVPGWHPMSGPGLLCDCGAVIDQWHRLRAELDPAA